MYLKNEFLSAILSRMSQGVNSTIACVSAKLKCHPCLQSRNVIPAAGLLGGRLPMLEFAPRMVRRRDIDFAFLGRGVAGVQRGIEFFARD